MKKIYVLIALAILIISITAFNAYNKPYSRNIATYKDNMTKYSSYIFNTENIIKINGTQLKILDSYYIEDKKELHFCFLMNKKFSLQEDMSITLLLKSGEKKVLRTLYESEGVFSRFQETWFNEIEYEDVNNLILTIESAEVHIPMFMGQNE